MRGGVDRHRLNLALLQELEEDDSSMTEKDNTDDRDHLSVRLNEAFERLEQRDDGNPGSTTDRGGQVAATEAPTSIAGILGVLLSLIALGAASYTAWTVYLQTQKNSRVQQLETRLTSLQQRVDGDQARIHNLTRELSRASGEVAAANAANKRDIANLQKQVAASIARIRASMGTSSRDWLYAEVEYLLRLANQRVAMEGNVKGALVLFHDADHIVRQSEGILAYDLRKSIADNIASLEAVKKVDVDGIYLRLGALIDQVSHLQQREHRFRARPVPPPPPPSAASGFGAQLLALVQRAGARLATLVDFRRNSQHIQPILPPKEEYYLRQNLILNLQLAQLALLRGDQAMYANSLRVAQQWVKGHFDARDAATAAMEKSLAQLQAIDIAQKMPDVSSSLKEVRKLMANFHDQPARAGGTK